VPGHLFTDQDITHQYLFFITTIMMSPVYPLFILAILFKFVYALDTILRTDPGIYGPPGEEFHYYTQQWPIGLAVSSTGRLFSCYTRGNYTFTLGEATNLTHEVPYPSSNLNLSPDDPLFTTSYNSIPFGSDDSSHLISVQALYITPETSSRPETLWVVDTGRPTITDPATGESTMPYAQPGGPKIIAISLSNNTIYSTYTFPPDVHFPDSYMNDIRLDLRPSTTPSRQGIAYIVDSSDEGRPGFIILDLGTRHSWRRLTQHPSVLRGERDVPSYVGAPFYVRQRQQDIGRSVLNIQEGLDGIQISPDGNTIYYSPLTSDYLYSIPTSALRANGPLAEQRARSAVRNLGQRGGNANGFEGDDSGKVYMLMPEQNAVYYYDPSDGLTYPFVRDQRMLWPDSASVGGDGYIYVNVNQLYFQPLWNEGVDLREWPGAVLRFKLPDGGKKVTSLY
jgi:hypothetical protein